MVQIAVEYAAGRGVRDGAMVTMRAVLQWIALVNVVARPQRTRAGLAQAALRGISSMLTSAATACVSVALLARQLRRRRTCRAHDLLLTSPLSCPRFRRQVFHRYFRAYCPHCSPRFRRLASPPMAPLALLSFLRRCQRKHRLLL
jgi:hypothetical protein